MPTPLDFMPYPEARPASQLAARPVPWLWPGRLALGKLAMLDADPGLGKSILTLELCARLSTGGPFPDDAPLAGPANCLLLNAEDGEQDTVLPRLPGRCWRPRRTNAVCGTTPCRRRFTC